MKIHYDNMDDDIIKQIIEKYKNEKDSDIKLVPLNKKKELKKILDKYNIEDIEDYVRTKKLQILKQNINKKGNQ